MNWKFWRRRKTECVEIPCPDFEDVQFDVHPLVTNPHEVGVCAVCEQELILTEDDCWHPWHVKRPCPASQYGRPGRENWRAA